MSKPSRGATRYAAGKKKAKKRYEPQPITQTSPSTAAKEPGQPQAGPDERSGGPVLQFRPRARETGRPAGGRGAAPARGFLQAVDYGYVYTDLKIIGGLSAFLLGGLVLLSFVVR